MCCVWMLMSLIIQLSGECGNTSEMNPPPTLLFAPHPSVDLQRFKTSPTSCQKRVVPERFVRQELKVTGILRM